MTGDDVFTVHAFATPGNVTADEILDEIYYLSIAVKPLQVGDPALGSFDISGPGTVSNVGDGVSLFGTSIAGGPTIAVVSNMTMGTPPIGSHPSLPPHDIFDTHFLEIEFVFDESDTAATRNVQDNPGEPLSAGDSLFAAFDLDISMFSEDVELHFDLYSTKVKNNGTITVDDFAPFSHDAETNGDGPVIPEPTTVAIWAVLGMLGMCGYRRARPLR